MAINIFGLRKLFIYIGNKYEYWESVYEEVKNQQKRNNTKISRSVPMKNSRLSNCSYICGGITVLMFGHHYEEHANEQ